MKRCLYLFAGSTYPDGRISACVFIDDDKVEADEINFFDYALFFVSTIYDYVSNTKDINILDDSLIGKISWINKLALKVF